MTVHVVGNACIDLSFWLGDDVPGGDVPAGATVLARRWSRAVGGKGLNQATAAARGGAETVLWAAVGDDAEAELIQAHLANEGIGLGGLAYRAGPTDLSAIWIGADGANRIVSAADQARAFRPADDPDLTADLAAGDVVVGQGNLRPAATEAVLRVARRAGSRTALNPSPLRDGAWPDLALADLVVLNAQEAGEITGARPTHAALERLRTMTPGAVVLTLGAEGAALAGPGGAVVRLAAPAVHAVDTSGAGDALFGTLVALWAGGMDLEAALASAVRVAARAVTRPGALTGLPSRAEVRALIADGDSHE